MLIGTPEEIKARENLWRFIVTNSTTSISIEALAQGLDYFKGYVTKYIFPNITLQSFKDMELVKTTSPKLIGENGIFEEQGYFNVLQRGLHLHFVWGLTRRGDWISGEVSGNIWPTEFTLDRYSSGELISATQAFFSCSYLDATAFILEQIKRAISGDLHEKRRRLNEIERVFGAVETFSDLISVRAGRSIR